MNAVDFFQGQFSFPVPSAVVEAAMFQRGMTADDDISAVETMERELTLADILVILSRSSQGFSQRTGSDAFSMTIKGEYVPLNDRRAMRDEANRIYTRYGEKDNVRTQTAINIFDQ